MTYLSQRIELAKGMVPGAATLQRKLAAIHTTMSDTIAKAKTLRDDLRLESETKARAIAAKAAASLVANGEPHLEEARKLRAILTPAALRRRARFSDDDTAHALLSASWSNRLQRATLGQLQSFAEDAASDGSFALAAAVAEELEARQGAGFTDAHERGTAESIRQTVDSVQLPPEAKSLAAVLDDFDRESFQWTGTWRQIQGKPRAWVESDIGDSQSRYVEVRQRGDVVIGGNPHPDAHPGIGRFEVIEGGKSAAPQPAPDILPAA